MNSLSIHDVRSVHVREDSSGETKWTVLIVESEDWQGAKSRIEVALFHHTADQPIKWNFVQEVLA